MKRSSTESRGETQKRSHNRTSSRLVRFTNCRLARGLCLVNEDLWTLDGKIIDPKSRWWTSNSNNEFLEPLEISCNGAILAPGYYDVQINGGFGIDFADSSHVTLEKMAEVSHKLLSHGVVAYLPTIISSSPQTYSKLIPKHNEIKNILNDRNKTLDNNNNNNYDDDDDFDPRHTKANDVNFINKPRAKILGLHLEGPFMHPSKKGAHDINCLSEPVDGMTSLMDTYGSLQGVKLITLAPELNGSFQAISDLHSQGVIVSMGHTSASFEQGVSGVRRGASMITHMFNAMTAFHHRDPGLIGLLGAEHKDRPFYGLICDGLHAHPASVKLASCAHPEGVILVTDAMCAMGLGDGSHSLGEMNVIVNGIKATLEGTDTLAGAVVSMDECVKNYRRFTECTAAEAIYAASTRPAQLLLANCVHNDDVVDHLHSNGAQCGTLLPGAPAEFILLNDDLDVLKVYIEAVQVWPQF